MRWRRARPRALGRRSLAISCPAPGPGLGRLGSVCALVFVFGGCGSATDPPDPAPEVAPDTPYVTTLDSFETFELFAGDEGAVKYLAPVDGTEPVPPITNACYFQNMGVFRWHMEFLRSLDGLGDLTFAQYEAWALDDDTRRWWAGALHFRPDARHPETGEVGVYAYDVYVDQTPGNAISFEALAALDEALEGCAPVSAGRLVFWPALEDTAAWASFYAESLAAMGVVVMSEGASEAQAAGADGE